MKFHHLSPAVPREGKVHGERFLFKLKQRHNAKHIVLKHQTKLQD
jgi:hypothetical protein